jgi:hypothetical protein
MVYGIIRLMENSNIYIHRGTIEDQRYHDALHGERMEQQWTPWKAVINKFMENMTKINILHSEIIGLRKKNNCILEVKPINKAHLPTENKNNQDSGFPIIA